MKRREQRANGRAPGRTRSEIPSGTVLPFPLLDRRSVMRRPSSSARLLELTRSFGSHQQVKPLLDAVVRGALELVDCEGGFAGALTGDGLRTHRYVRKGHALSLERTWTVGEGLPGWLLRRNTPYLTNRAAGDPRIDRAIAQRFKVRSALAVPIRDPRGEVAGFVVLHNHRSPGGFTGSDVEAVEEIAASASVPLRNATTFEGLRAEDGPRTTGDLHAQRLQAVGRLAGGVAHDFNNLLTVVLGETDLLLEGSPGRDGRPELHEIRDAAMRARALTRRLLAFSRKDPVDAESLDVSRSMRDMARLLRRLVGTNIRIEEDFADDLPVVSLSPSRLDQVVMNLAVNARDAMPRGGTLTLRTSRASGLAPGTAENPGATENGRWSPEAPDGVLIQVADTGEGMDDETRRRVFDPYFTTKDPENGTGLGLSTVAEIVRGAGGRIAVDSVQDRGTIFSIHLPGAHRSRMTTRTKTSMGTREEQSGATILLVEDDDSVRRLVRRALQRHGHQVLEAPTGAEALELAGEGGRPIDLLLADVMLPDMGGIQLWQLLSGRIAGHRTIFMSGYLEDDLPQIDLDRNDVEFLPKPFAIKDLLSLVGSVLRRR